MTDTLAIAIGTFVGGVTTGLLVSLLIFGRGLR